MSYTPRTDAAKRSIPGFADEWVPRYISEELERELAEARAQRDTVANALQTAIINDPDSPSWKIKVANKALATVKGGTNE